MAVLLSESEPGTKSGVEGGRRGRQHCDSQSTRGLTASAAFPRPHRPLSEAMKRAVPQAGSASQRARVRRRTPEAAGRAPRAFCAALSGHFNLGVCEGWTAGHLEVAAWPRRPMAGSRGQTGPGRPGRA